MNVGLVIDAASIIEEVLAHSEQRHEVLRG